MPDRPTPLPAGGTNAVGRMLSLLGDEWNLLIIQQALLGAHRYTHFTARLPVSNSVLAKRLRMLVDEGLLTPDYLTTARSRSLWPLLLSIWEWERTWVPEHSHHLPAMAHQECGRLFSPVLRCAACRHPVTGIDDVSVHPGPSGGWQRSAPVAATRRRSDPDASTRQAGLFPETMSVLGNRWAAALLVAAFLGTTRFTDFQSQLGVPPTLLTERLQTFVDIGVLHSGPDGRYLLTDKGRAFFGILVIALQWAQRWFHAPDGPALTLTHRDCGRAFTAELACGHCRGALAGAQVAAVTSVPAVGSP